MRHGLVSQYINNVEFLLILQEDIEVVSFA